MAVEKLVQNLQCLNTFHLLYLAEAENDERAKELEDFTPWKVRPLHLVRRIVDLNRLGKMLPCRVNISLCAT